MDNNIWIIWEFFTFSQHKYQQCWIKIDQKLIIIFFFVKKNSIKFDYNV